jgi:hypothetical protein
VVTVSGGLEPDDVQDIRLAPRPTAAARVIAALVDLGPCRVVDDLPLEPLPWDDVVAPVRDGRAGGWVAESIGPTSRLRFAHLRWSGDGRAPATTAMLLVLAGADGLVEAVGTDEGFLLVSRTPTEVWTALCALTRSGRAA